MELGSGCTENNQGASELNNDLTGLIFITVLIVVVGMIFGAGYHLGWSEGWSAGYGKAVDELKLAAPTKRDREPDFIIPFWRCNGALVTQTCK